MGFPMTFMPDSTDRRILRQLLAEPEAANATLAERAGVTSAALWRRLERMREAGVLKGVQARIDWRAMGWAVEVSLRFTLDKTNPRAFDEFRAAGMADLLAAMVAVAGWTTEVQPQLRLHVDGVAARLALDASRFAEAEAFPCFGEEGVVDADHRRQHASVLICGIPRRDGLQGELHRAWAGYL